MTLQDILYYAVCAGVNLEKNRTTLHYIPSVGDIRRYQVECNRKGTFYSECFREIDPAVRKFLELSK
jgi:hypothetical protein